MPVGKLPRAVLETKIFCCLNKNAFCYSLTMLAAMMMNSVHRFYYVNVFLDRYHVREVWFHWVQILFLIWNAVNDPLFGYFQDKHRTRQSAVRYGSLFYGISFILFWFPWTNDGQNNPIIVGFHLLISLFLYDAMFTYVLLAQCAIFAEISKVHRHKVRLIRYAQVASLIGSISVLICNLSSDNLKNFTVFQIVCVVIGIIASILIFISGKFTVIESDVEDISSEVVRSLECDAETRETEPQDDVTADHEVEVEMHSVETRRNDIEETDSRIPGQEIDTDANEIEHEEELETDEQKDKEQKPDGDQYTYLSLTLQIVKERDFITFVLVNLCTIFGSTFSSNFTKIFGDHLVSEEAIPATAKSIFYGSMFVLPQTIVILGSPLVARIGYYRIIRWSFIIKVVMAAIMLCVGPNNPWILMFFIILDASNSDVVFSLYNLPLSDIIEEDMKRHKRSLPVSSMVFGTNALITKPAHSLAPMFAVWILNSYGYDRLQSTENGLAPAELDSLFSTMFNMACLVPIVIGIVCSIIWFFYTLRETHTKTAKFTET